MCGCCVDADRDTQEGLVVSGKGVLAYRLDVERGGISLHRVSNDVRS